MELYEDGGREGDALCVYSNEIREGNFLLAVLIKKLCTSVSVQNLHAHMVVGGVGGNVFFTVKPVFERCMQVIWTRFYDCARLRGAGHCAAVILQLILD